MDSSPSLTSQPHSDPRPDIEGGWLDHTSSVFRPVNPWKMTLRQCLMARHSIDTIRTIDDVQPNMPMFTTVYKNISEECNSLGEKIPGDDQVIFAWRSTTIAFLTDWLPRRIFINLLFRIPNVYFSRIEKTFEEAGESLVDMKRRALDESRGIKQSDLRAVEVRLVPIRIGRITFDLVYVFTFMLVPAFIGVWMWIGWFSSKPLDPVLKAPGILVSISVLVANFTSFDLHETIQISRIAAWKFNVAMDTRGIHQPFLWNVCVDLSIYIVWTIWGYIFFTLFVLLSCLRRYWHLTIYAKIAAEPLTGMMCYMILGIVFFLGLMSFFANWYHFDKSYEKWDRVDPRVEEHGGAEHQVAQS